MANAKSKKAPIDVNAFLAGAASAPKPKGSKIPVLDAGELADDTANAYREWKDAEAHYRLKEAEVLKITNPEYERRARKGEFTKSFNLPGNETDGVQAVYTDKFSDLPNEAEKGLREQLGDKFDLYFEQKRVLNLVKTDDDTIALLVKKLGPEVFADIFEVKLSLAAKDDLDRRQFDIPEAVRTLCGLKQAKPGVKLIKKSTSKK